MPDESKYPRPAAEAVRSFLLLRLGLHLGLRQKNLRQLRVCPGGHYPTSERRLENLKCGDLPETRRPLDHVDGVIRRAARHGVEQIEHGRIDYLEPLPTSGLNEANHHFADACPEIAGPC